MILVIGDRFEPAYRKLLATGELAARRDAALAMLTQCRLCPRECGVSRTAGETGFCRSGAQAVVASYGPHFGEERPLVGTGGSGTVFFTNCTLRCIFCQNYDISHLGAGQPVTDERLAAMMLELQQRGCHNINLVTPTHFVPQILAGLTIAAQEGLALPLVYNCSGYESVETLGLLDGVVDIYMPDAKYADGEIAEQLSAALDYPERVRAALAEMHRQVGDLEIDAGGLARRGLLVRHLVLPAGLAGTADVMRFLAGLSPDTYVNVMAQYRPCFRAGEVDEISRRPTVAEYRTAVQAALDAGLHRLDERPLAILRG
jgi:putative pyruvate formate lyase activating enzyme